MEEPHAVCQSQGYHPAAEEEAGYENGNLIVAYKSDRSCE